MISYLDKMNKIKLFVSYQHNIDSNLAAHIESVLPQRINNVEVIADKSAIQVSEDIHEKISEALDDCHCLIVPSSSTNSSEVSRELIQAWERGKEIIFVSEKETRTDIDLGQHLDFLTGKLMISYTDFNDLIRQLIDYFENKTVEDFEIIPKSFREIQKRLIDRKINRDTDNVSRFQRELIRKILDETKSEISNILGLDYTLDVGIERNFIIRAESIFKNADEVYAISLDHISTFWTQVRQKAKEYVDNQVPNTIRLFVFSTPKIANSYREILQASHQSYGHTGAVLLCSLDSYHMFLRKYLSSSRNLDRYLGKDFGILRYMNRDIEAFLDNSELKFNTIDLNSTRLGLNYKGLISDFERLKKLDFEEPYVEEYRQDRPQVIIKKWNPDCFRDNDVWSQELLKLFPKQTSGEMYHLVCFKDKNGNFRGKLHEIVAKLKQKKDRLGIKEIWFGRQPEQQEKPVIDHIFKGKLKISKDYDYILMMKFEDYERMKTYYENQQHSLLREDLYASMNEGLKYLFQELKSFSQQDKVLKVYENLVEEVVSHYMVRHDFLGEEDVFHIVQESPIPFLDTWMTRTF